MIRVNVMYPKQDDGNFDYDYYLNTHMPLVGERWADGLRGMEVYRGLSGAGGALKLTSPSPTLNSIVWRRFNRRWKHTHRRSWETFPTSPISILSYRLRNN